MPAELISSSANGSLSAVLATSKAFVVAHPIGMAVAGGALLGIGSYVSLGRYFSKRKQERELAKQVSNNADAVQAA